MTEVLTGYTSPGFWKGVNLESRAQAFRLDYIHRIEKLGIIAPGSRVLELGSGQGHKTKKIEERFSKATIIGLELHAEMIKRARKRLPNTEFIHGDMTKTEDVPCDIDVAFYIQSLHHLDVQQRSEAAEVIYDKLTPSGKVVVIDSFNPNEYLNRAYAVLGQHPGTKLEQVYHSARSLIKPGEYNPKDYGYHSPLKTNVLGENQSDMFRLTHDITPFFGKAISDILVFEKQ